MIKKTKLMLEAEKRIMQPLESALPNMVSEMGLAKTAQELGVSTSTVNYWMLKLGIHTQRVALLPGEDLVIKRTA